ncbi:MAG: phasin family protein [Ahrensia sp.]|nr:phasin family protein [Ahrensia sp.]
MTKKMDMNEAKAQSQEFLSKGIATSEKVVDGMIEVNAAMFKGGETIVKKMYDNYVDNVAATFDGMKALNKSSDMGEFFKTATSNAAAATERVSDQTKGMAELSSKVLRETAEVGRNAFTKSFQMSA